MDTKRILLALSLVGMTAAVASGQSQGRRVGWRSIAAGADSAASVQVQVEPLDAKASGAGDSGKDDRDDDRKHDRDCEDHGGLTGSWLGPVTYAGETPFQAFFTFGSECTFVGSAQGDVLLDERVVFSSQHGAWSQKGRKKFALRMLILLYDSQAELIVTLRIRFKIRLAARNTWLATFSQDEILPDGTVLDDVLSGTAEASRIRVQ